MQFKQGRDSSVAKRKRRPWARLTDYIADQPGYKNNGSALVGALVDENKLQFGG